MKAAARVLATLVCLVGANGAVVRETQAVSPIAKVLELLTGLEAKIHKEGDDEAKAHKEYVEWCDTGRANMGFEIKTLKSEIEDLTATKEKAISDIASEKTKIEDLGGSISQDDADLKAATEIREKEAAEFHSAEVELMDVVGTLDRAINVLERKLRSSALVQAQVNTKDVQELIKTLSAVVDAASLGNRDKRRLVAMVQDASDDSEDDFGAPAAAVYASKSEGIVEVLEDLRGKAESELAELRNQETAAKHSFEMEAQSLRDSMAASTKEMNQAKATLASASETQATSQGDLAVAIESLEETTTSLKTQSAGCSTAVEDFAASQASREEELKALAAAVEALKGGLNAAESSVYGSFLQMSSISGADEHTSSRLQTTADLANFEVVNLIRRLARKENSAALSQLASRVAAAIRFGSQSGEDPFAKVKGLISDMITTLEKEAGQEASHKAWCDEQYGETKTKTDDLSHTVDRLSSKIDKAKAESMTLKDEVKELQASLAQIAKSQAELDQLRRAQNKAYVAARSDMETGLRGVRTAMKVLREYYEGDGAEASHTKAEGAGSSIIGFLEVIQSDLSKGLAQAEMVEDSAATEYEKVGMQNRLNVKGYESDVKYKTKEAASLDKAVTEMSSDRDSSQTELDAILEYSKTVRAACEVKPETYEERKARRQAEVSGLKEALSILSEQGSFLQMRHRGLRR